MVLLHLGALHPVEQLLTLLLAFGPFVLLGIVLWRRRGEGDESPGSSESPDGGATRKRHP